LAYFPSAFRDARRAGDVSWLGAGVGLSTYNQENQVTKKKERTVLVTTAHKGVFFGYATETSGATIKLRAARNCVYWSSDVKGFLGLAANGPSRDCRIGPAADLELRDITSVAEVTEEAAKKWTSHPWAA
jgi:hypothetical protein